MNFSGNFKTRACAALCAILMVCASSVAVSAAPKINASQGAKISQSSGSISTASLRSVAASYNVPSEFLNAIRGKSSISVAQLKSYASQYKLPAQYVQRFITDQFVFTSGNTLRYVNVDTSLARHSYDLSKLTTSGTEKLHSSAQKGIDVSEFQGSINWNRVKADGVTFAFIRLGYRGYGTGKINLDKYFHQNMKGAISAGIPVGVYFYTQAINEAEAREEAAFVANALNGYNVSLPVAFDIESAGSSSARTARLTSAQNTAITRAFCDAIEDYGYDSIIYANSLWFTSKLDMRQLEGYKKWIAQYYQVLFFPYDFDIWQYTGAGRVDGISGSVDMNLGFDGSYGQHIKLRMGGRYD